MKSSFFKSIFIIGVIAIAETTVACSTCYGDPNSNAGKGMDMAIITLLGVIGPILFAIAAGIISIGLKSRKVQQELEKND